MSKLKSPGHSRIVIQIGAAGAVAALLSGCSSDMSRFNDPFGNPFSTGSVAKPQHVASAKPMGTGRTPPVMSQALPPRSSTVASAAPVRAAAPQVSHETTGSIAPAATVPGASFGGWSASGGASVVVAQGETADILSKRYGVPQNALLGVNGLRSPADLQPGARIIVPIYNAVATAGTASPPVHRPEVAAPRVAVAAPVVEAPVVRAVPVVEAPMVRAAPVVQAPRVVVAAPPVHHVVAAAAPLPKVIAVVSPKLKPEPKAKVAVVVAAPKAAVVVAAPKVALVTPAHVMKGAAEVKTASLDPAPKVKPAPAVKTEKVAVAPAKPGVAAPVAKVAAAAPAAKVAEAVAPKTVDPSPTASVAAAAPAAAEPVGPEFRWPARGRIIQGFKGGAGGNDGINIAVPEGTAVKAAENGVVAYAGSELKGYGNMVLIRHPNGFVSAYANNGEIDVKKGDTVKRGQTIAKSGQTGNVASPQLHFELRKGAQPVDPTSYLAGL